jgi:intergrase/recombinase
LTEGFVNLWGGGENSPPSPPLLSPPPPLAAVNWGRMYNNNNNNHHHHHYQQQQFHSWLVSQGKTKWTIKESVNYAKRFGHVLDTGNATPLLTLSQRNKQHALTALANLAKFTGRYEQFNQIRRNYNLRWYRSDSIKSFERFFNEGLTLDVMLSRIKEMMRLLPENMSKIIRFGILVGLRASEVVEATRLINDNNQTLQKYYNAERQVLEHFRFPCIFLRQTKKAYISFVTAEMIEHVQQLDKVPTLNAITLACHHKGIKMEMYLTRKIFASHLRREGIQPEVVDMLQGRVSQSVLTRHYLVPQSSLKDQVLDALKKLQRELE